MSDDDARVRLEGGAQLLEATRIRYRLLVRALKSRWWPRRLQRTASVLHEVARVQPEVELALELAQRHARSEHWPQSSALWQCVREVAQLREQLERLTHKRLGNARLGLDLKACFEALEHQVLTAPRVVLPGQRWATARRVLPWPSDELTPVAQFAGQLEQVFGRPLTSLGTLAFSLEECDALAATWPEGVRALERVWSRLAALDVSSLLVRYLRTRARRTPVAARTTGPEVLLHAEFWRTMACSRIEALLSARVGPVVALEAEWFSTLRWLWQLERQVPSSLLVSPPSRAALIELAVLINQLPSNRQWAGVWPRLLELAERADTGRTDPDWQRLHDSLAVLGRVLQPTAARATPPNSLVGLLRSIR